MPTSKKPQMKLYVHEFGFRVCEGGWGVVYEDSELGKGRGAGDEAFSLLTWGRWVMYGLLAAHPLLGRGVGVQQSVASWKTLLGSDMLFEAKTQPSTTRYRHTGNFVIFTCI